MKQLILIIPLLIVSCTVKYGATIGGQTREELKTFNVLTFTASNANVPANFSQLFTEALKQRVLNQSKLTITNTNPDVEFSGVVASYVITPINISDGDVAAQNRLTIIVRVNYIDNLDPKKNFTESFTQYQDYAADREFSSIANELHEKLIELLSISIFNKTFSDW
jgi:hypothetical protein